MMRTRLARLPQVPPRTRIRCIDVETTGLYGARVVEIAFVEVMRYHGLSMASHEIIDPGIPITPEATEKHKLTDEDVKGARTFEDAVWLYMDTRRDLKVTHFVAHNWEFEQQWLGEYVGDREVIDTYAVAEELWPYEPKYTLERLSWSKKLGDFNGEPHEALPDAIQGMKLFLHMLKEATLDDMVRWSRPDHILTRCTSNAQLSSPPAPPGSGMAGWRLPFHHGVKGKLYATMSLDDLEQVAENQYIGPRNRRAARHWLAKRKGLC